MCVCVCVCKCVNFEFTSCIIYIILYIIVIIIKSDLAISCRVKEEAELIESFTLLRLRGEQVILADNYKQDILE